MKGSGNKEKNKGDATSFASGTTIGHLGLHLLILNGIIIIIRFMIISIIIIIIMIIIMIMIISTQRDDLGLGELEGLRASPTTLCIFLVG